MNDENVRNNIQFLNDEAEDNAYCEQLLQEYLNDSDPHKHDSVSLEEAMELCGVTASEIEALEELEYMKKHPEEYKSYESVDEMFKDILGDEWDSDYTKVTPSERERIEHAESSGFIADEDIDRDHLEKYAE